jgi:rhamnulokinase
LGQHHYVACDLGAESCRLILGTLAEDRLTIEEVHRFPNRPIKILGTLRWNLPQIFDELVNGLRKVAARGLFVDSVSVDSWGVDYVYIRDQEPMLTLPYHYRDPRTDGTIARAFAAVPSETIYSETGIQFIQINTLYQMLDDLENRPTILEISDQFLNIADYFNYIFSGLRCAEESLASTTQLFNPHERKWSRQLIERFALPARIFPKLVKSGTKLGPLLAEIADEVGLHDTQVVAGCSHDTGAAVAAVPAEGQDWCYISSGTWSAMGIEAKKPIINDASRTMGFANEMGYGGTTRFLKDIVGLWVVQECRREWAREGYQYSYEDLAKMAEEALPLRSMIDPVDPRFVKPCLMPQKIINYCRETKQTFPTTHGEIIRCVLDSLALRYRQVLQEITSITGHEFKSVHIVGGGSRNQLLNQLTANATQVEVLAGPSEATAVGNILVQAIAMGHLRSLEDLRHVVRSSFPVASYRPQDKDAWLKAYERFQELPVISDQAERR